MSFYANHPTIISTTDLEIENARGTELNLDARLDKINSSLDGKIKTMIFTSIADSTVSISHNLSYSNLTDELQVFDLYTGGLLSLGEHYTEDSPTSILLTSWSLKIGDKLKLILYKSVK